MAIQRIHGNFEEKYHEQPNFVPLEVSSRAMALSRQMLPIREIMLTVKMCVAWREFANVEREP